MEFVKRIIRSVIAFILIFNISIFGYMAAPAGTTAVEVAQSGMTQVITAAKDVIIPGEIYQLDLLRPIVQALIRLDSAYYSAKVGHLVTVGPGWKAYVITGDLARKIMLETHSLAFTDFMNKIVIFLAVDGADPNLIIAHEFTHVLQAEDGLRVAFIPRVVAEYEAEVLSRTVVSLLANLSLPKAYSIHQMSKLEKLQVRRYFAVMGI